MKEQTYSPQTKRESGKKGIIKKGRKEELKRKDEMERNK